MRIIPPPKGEGRWQVWYQVKKVDASANVLVGRYRTKLSALIIRWSLERNNLLSGTYTIRRVR